MSPVNGSRATKSTLVQVMPTTQGITLGQSMAKLGVAMLLMLLILLPPKAFPRTDSQKECPKP
jgi:hypothetical protein